MSGLDQLMVELFDDEAELMDAETRFASCGGWDSLKYVQLVAGIETRYNVDLTADEIGRLTSKRAVRGILATRGIHV